MPDSTLELVYLKRLHVLVSGMEMFPYEGTHGPVTFTTMDHERLILARIPCQFCQQCGGAHLPHEDLIQFLD